MNLAVEQRVKKRGVPASLQRFMPLKGEAALKKIAGDATLFVQGVQEGFPCRAMAIHLLHAAQDGGYANICILKGIRHRHYFKVWDLVRHMRKWSGPSLFSFQTRKNCWLDEKKKIWQVGWQPKPNAEIIPANK